MTGRGVFSLLRQAVPDAIFMTVALAVLLAVVGYEDGAALLAGLQKHVSVAGLSAALGSHNATIALLTVVVAAVAALDAAILRHVYRVHAHGRRRLNGSADRSRFLERS